MSKRLVYADNAATTRLSAAAYEAMLPFLRDGFGNPSSVYSLGRDAAKAVLEARQRVAAAIGADVQEIYFTSCGSEADNQAIRSAALSGAASGKRHIVTSAFEHHAVLHTCDFLKTQGYDITYVTPDRNGLISPDQVRNALRDDTCLVTIMYANNEIGTIQPVPEIAALCKESGVTFHTDAVQAVGHIPINVKQQVIDMLSLSGHKLHAPKGVGVLYVNRRITPSPLIFGGSQERGRRAGTENVPAIVGLGAAITDAVSGIDERRQYVLAMRDKLIDGLFERIPDITLNGDRHTRLEGNVNISIKGIEGESLLMLLDMQGICASSGSACESSSLDPSHVLRSIGLDEAAAKGSLRLTINEENTDDDIDYILEKLPEAVTRLRELS
ncbi:MAG: cysteine desulfurase NifS [Ruminococcus sp.]|nr:cysteine desulfurase NifS [Ruminococcus sp.]